MSVCVCARVRAFSAGKVRIRVRLVTLGGCSGGVHIGQSGTVHAILMSGPGEGGMGNSAVKSRW